MQGIKLFMIALIIIGQLVGLVLLFINMQWAITLYTIYGIALILLFIIMFFERKKEKREEDPNDYRNY
ncbi:hypothetical protein [Peribacillus alkalitolerans]|uniref:hypothetical protein n=1 Tax=Peribacillus alkalitolerans TaxID=1550385 RepID=UPI0013D39E24|nr:hypothetical protein [Peribacillus alkalitolerans]